MRRLSLTILSLLMLLPGRLVGDEFADDVPVPLDTFSTDEVEGYVPDVYHRRAPDPAPIAVPLRPRYSGQTATESPIRQVADRDPPPSPEAPALAPPAPETTGLATPSPIQRQESETHSVELPKKKLIAPEAPTRMPVDMFEADRMTINNDHSCDDVSCGGGGCGCSSGWLLRHLGDDRPRRGVCGCCGLLTCANKTRGPWFFDGWVSVGAFLNTHWPDGKSNSPLYYNDRNGEMLMNQLYLSFGKRVDTRRNRIDWGGRVDLLYGTDYYYTSALGLETRRYTSSITSTGVRRNATLDPLEADLRWNAGHGSRRMGTAAMYGLSMPQAYAELFLPVASGVTVKAGHFYSGMGLESAMSPQNFFYSHSYSFMYGAPVTLTGATASVRLGSRLTGVVGVTEGWNTWDNPTGNISGLAGLHWKSRDNRRALSFLVHTGEESLRGSDNRTNYTLTYEQKLGRSWSYALEHAYGYEKNGALRDLFTQERGPARWISLAQYLQWQWSETLSFGLRAEWFRDDGHSRIQKGQTNPSLFGLSVSGKDYYELTLGMNWKPTRYLTIRPEVRYDWSDVKINDFTGSSGIYSNDEKREMVSFAVDAVFRF